MCGKTWVFFSDATKLPSRISNCNYHWTKHFILSEALLYQRKKFDVGLRKCSQVLVICDGLVAVLRADTQRFRQPRIPLGNKAFV